MNLALWIIAALLAALYAAVGLTKVIQPKEKLLTNPNLGWVNDFSGTAVKTIGSAEVLGALGLILPRATGIAVMLTPLAAVGLVLLQAGAIRVHLGRHEHKDLPINLLLLALAAFVAVGRFAG